MRFYEIEVRGTITGIAHPPAGKMADPVNLAWLMMQRYGKRWLSIHEEIPLERKA